MTGRLIVQLAKPAARVSRRTKVADRPGAVVHGREVVAQEFDLLREPPLLTVYARQGYKCAAADDGDARAS